MNLCASSHYPAADVYRRHLVDTIVTCGPLAAHVLMAEERHREAEQMAALWALTHANRMRAPGAGRRWLGTLLVRVGGRLQGAPVAPLPPDPAAVAGSAGAAG
jgi:hypothetical protein